MGRTWFPRPSWALAGERADSAGTSLGPGRCPGEPQPECRDPAVGRVRMLPGLRLLCCCSCLCSCGCGRGSWGCSTEAPEGWAPGLAESSQGPSPISLLCPTAAVLGDSSPGPSWPSFEGSLSRVCNALLCPKSWCWLRNFSSRLQGPRHPLDLTWSHRSYHHPWHNLSFQVTTG